MTNGAASDIILVISRYARALKAAPIVSSLPVPRLAASNVRLYVDRELAATAAFALDKSQAHYLVNVMRLAVGDPLQLFNGRDGEWLATVTESEKGRARVVVGSQTRAQEQEPDLWLAIAPVGSARLKIVVEKATELGVAAITPVITQHTTVTRVNLDRLRAQATEAAEQCGRLSVPTFHDPQVLIASSRPGRRIDPWCSATRPAQRRC